MSKSGITSLAALRAHKLHLKQRIIQHDQVLKHTMQQLPAALLQRGIKEIGSHIKLDRIGQLAGMALRSPLVKSTGKGLVAGFVADKALHLGIKFGSRWLGNLLKKKL